MVWPDADILPGITMNLLKDVHADSETRPVSVHDLKDMEAAFATNVTVGVRAIAAIDDRQFPADHPIIQTLRAKYTDIPAQPL